MIVFPERRSVGLKAATASSRVATVPMFVRSRPSRTRCTISLSWARSDSTTKSIARAVGGPRLDRPDDGHQRSAGSNQARGPLADIAADEIEHQIDFANVFQGLAVEVDELVRAEVQRPLTVGGAAGADHVGAELTCELRHHRPDRAGRAVRDDTLPCPKATVLEQSLPRSQARDRQARAHCEVDVARQRREVACLDGHVLRQCAVAIPVREAEHPLSDRQPRRAIAEGGDHSGQLVPRNRRCSVTAEAIGPGRRPTQLGVDESRCMNLNDDVVDRWSRLGPLHQPHPGRSRTLFRHNNRLHHSTPATTTVSLYYCSRTAPKGSTCHCVRASGKRGQST